ncbi:S8 family peptidase [Bacillus cereus]|uniref:S8 family peptidase n=1 Tax=Bacillus cereus group sp. MYBK185-1 TaxID=3450672 RepID=UPI0037872897
MPDNKEAYELPLLGNKESYIITPIFIANNQSSGMQPMAAHALNEYVANMGLEVVKRIRPSTETLGAMGVGAGVANETIVAKIEPERAEIIRQTLPPNLVISKDRILNYGDPVKPKITLTPLYATPNLVTRKFKFQIVGKNKEALDKITVQLVGDGYPVDGVTNENGEIELEIQTVSANLPRFLQLMAPHSYRDIYLSHPQIEENKVNIIQMQLINENPEQNSLGWGQKLLGIDKLPKGIDGKGVKIAIIDSGCDNSHPLLQHIRYGRDFTANTDPANWNQDVIGHGTHCAGIIAARQIKENGMRGFAPESEVHILRVFPGGAYSSLIDAIYYCIEQQIDVINMSLGGDSNIDVGIEQALTLAVQNGIACIVAAGNSGDSVKYPASSPQTLAVSAIGYTKELQPNTWEYTTVQEGLVATDGVFSPNFTCFGPEIAVCAPGVDIISTVPGGHFELMSGTSMAAPHITGIAALLLAHHPVFQNEFKVRNVQRVKSLFDMIRTICTPYPLGPIRVGAGLPKLDQVITALQATLSPSRIGTAITATPAGIPLTSISNSLRPLGALPGISYGWNIQPTTNSNRFY